MKNYNDNNPKNTLKDKAGDGGVPQRLLDDAQSFMKNNNIDFRPIATDHLVKIEEHLALLKSSQVEKEQQESYAQIVENVMQIKAHGGMFQYSIMSQIADISLDLLEKAQDINEDLYQLIEAHNNSIRLVIKNNFIGDGGLHGKAILAELQKARTRYYDKHKDSLSG